MTSANTFSLRLRIGGAGCTVHTVILSAGARRLLSVNHDADLGLNNTDYPLFPLPGVNLFLLVFNHNYDDVCSTASV